MLSISHRYADDPPAAPDAFTVTLMLQDNNGAQSAPQTKSVFVNNVAPSLSIAVSPTTINAGATTTLSGTVSDPGALDAHTIFINWGDGSGDQQVAMPAGTTAIPAQPHVYMRAGSYTINVAASDDDGGMSVAVSQAVTVLEVAPAAPSDLAATAVSPTQIDG